MDSDWSPDYKSWMREQFPQLNLSLDNELSIGALTRFAEQIVPISNAIAHDQSSDLRERLTYTSMMHSAFYHHTKRAAGIGISIPESVENALSVIERLMIELSEVDRRRAPVFIGILFILQSGDSRSEWDIRAVPAERIRNSVHSHQPRRYVAIQAWSNGASRRVSFNAKSQFVINVPSAVA